MNASEEGKRGEFQILCTAYSDLHRCNMELDGKTEQLWNPKEGCFSVVLRHPGYQVLSASLELLKLLGYPQDYWCKHSIFDFVHGADCMTLQTCLTDDVHKQNSVLAPIRGVRRKCHDFYLRFRQYHGTEGSYKLKDDDRPKFTTFVVRLESAEQYIGSLRQSAGLTSRLIKNVCPEEWQAKGQELKAAVERIKCREEYNNRETVDDVVKINEVFFYHKSVVEAKRYQKYVSEVMVDAQFPALAVRMIEYFIEAGLLDEFSRPVFIPCYLMVMTCMSYADLSPQFGKALAEEGMVKTANKIIKDPSNAIKQKLTTALEGIMCMEKQLTIIQNDIQQDEQLVADDIQWNQRIIKITLGVLYNISRAEGVNNYFEEAGVEQNLMKYITIDTQMKMIATLCLVHISDETENARFEDSGSIPYLIDYTKNAIEDTTRRYNGFSTIECVAGLAKLAVNDNNKTKLVEGGILPLLVQMLEYNDPQEHYEAARTVCTLSFSEEVKKKIQQEPGLVDTLKKLSATSTDKMVKREVELALWEIQDKSSTIHVRGDTRNHVFISYSHAYQNEVIKIKDKLKASGYRVWIDMEQMGGSTLDAMARGIEEAAVVLICMSDSYKDSNSCHSEAEYVYGRRKPFIPLMMQRHFKPSGWLGFIVGATLYMNFDGKFKFDDAFNMLIRELDGRGKTLQPQKPGALDVVDGPKRPASKGYKDWSAAQVQVWLKKSGIQCHDDKFAGYDGNLVYQMKQMERKSPEFCYNTLKSEFKFNLKEILMFMHALEELE